MLNNSDRQTLSQSIGQTQPVYAMNCNKHRPRSWLPRERSSQKSELSGQNKKKNDTGWYRAIVMALTSDVKNKKHPSVRAQWYIKNSPV